MHPERANGLYVVPERLFVEYGALNPMTSKALTDDDGLLTNCVMTVIEKPPDAGSCIGRDIGVLLRR